MDLFHLKFREIVEGSTTSAQIPLSVALGPEQTTTCFVNYLVAGPVNLSDITLPSYGNQIYVTRALSIH